MMQGRYFRLVVLSTALLTLLAASALAQGPINTIPVWNGTSFISSFGVVDTATYGETVTVAAGASPLRSFAFELGYCGANVTFRGSVYAWDGTKATGSSLFESAPMTVSAAAAFQRVTFNTGELALPAGTYVLMASTSQDQAEAPYSACRWGAIGNNSAYSGGAFVFLNNGPNPAQWTTRTWSTFGQDLAFQVDGLVVPSAPAPAPVPAASTTSLLIGLAALTAVGLFQLSRRHRVV